MENSINFLKLFETFFKLFLKPLLIIWYLIRVDRFPQSQHHSKLVLYCVPVTHDEARLRPLVSEHIRHRPGLVKLSPCFLINQPVKMWNSAPEAGKL